MYYFKTLLFLLLTLSSTVTLADPPADADLRRHLEVIQNESEQKLRLKALQGLVQIVSNLKENREESDLSRIHSEHATLMHVMNSVLRILADDKDEVLRLEALQASTLILPKLAQWGETIDSRQEKQDCRKMTLELTRSLLQALFSRPLHLLEDTKLNGDGAAAAAIEWFRALHQIAVIQQWDFDPTKLDSRYLRQTFALAASLLDRRSDEGSLTMVTDALTRFLSRPLHPQEGFVKQLLDLAEKATAILNQAELPETPRMALNYLLSRMALATGNPDLAAIAIPAQLSVLFQPEVLDQWIQTGKTPDSNLAMSAIIALSRMEKRGLIGEETQVRLMEHLSPLIKKVILEWDSKTALQNLEKARIGLRGFHLNSVVDALDLAIEDSFESVFRDPENPLDLKKAACNIADLSSNWWTRWSAERPPILLRDGTWNYAYHSLSFLFLLKSAKHCPDSADRVVRPFLWGLSGVPVSNPSIAQRALQLFVETDELFQTRGFEVHSTLRKLLDPNAGFESKSTEGAPWDIASLYGKIFHLTALQSLLTERPLSTALRLILTPQLKMLEDGVNANLKTYPKALQWKIVPNGPSLGSLMNTYGLAAGFLSVETPPEIVRNAMVRTIPTQASKRLALPYYPRGLDYAGGSASNSERAAVGRAASYFLGLAMSESDPEKRKIYFNDVVNAVDLYSRYAGMLILHSRRGAVIAGERDGEAIRSLHAAGDSIGNHYFYASLPYVASAIEYLVRNELPGDNLSSTQKTKLNSARSRLIRKISKLLAKDDLFDNTLGGFAALNGVIQPLGGLALLSLMVEPGETPRTVKIMNGIVN